MADVHVYIYTCFLMFILIRRSKKEQQAIYVSLNLIIVLSNVLCAYYLA